VSRPCISGVLHRESTILKSAMMPVKLVCRRIHGENPHAHPPATGKKETREDRAEEEEERVESINTHTVFFFVLSAVRHDATPACVGDYMRAQGTHVGPCVRVRVSACVCTCACVSVRVQQHACKRSRVNLYARRYY